MNSSSLIRSFQDLIETLSRFTHLESLVLAHIRKIGFDFDALLTEKVFMREYILEVHDSYEWKILVSKSVARTLFSACANLKCLTIGRSRSPGRSEGDASSSYQYWLGFVEQELENDGVNVASMGGFIHTDAWFTEIQKENMTD